MLQTSTPRELLVLDAFLSDMDSLDASPSALEDLAMGDLLLSDQSSAVSDSGSAGSTEARRKTTKAKRTRSQRLQIQDLHREIESLVLQLESLRANQLLGDSLEQFLNPTQYRPNYRLLATDERQSSERAYEENAQLKKRLRKNLRLANAVRKAMQRQIDHAKVQVTSCWLALPRIELACCVHRRSTSRPWALDHAPRSLATASMSRSAICCAQTWTAGTEIWTESCRSACLPLRPGSSRRSWCTQTAVVWILRTRAFSLSTLSRSVTRSANQRTGTPP